jgi:ATP-dependent Clp protease ATP-binding subunit ClpC
MAQDEQGDWNAAARTEEADAILVEAGEWATHDLVAAPYLRPAHLLIALLSLGDAAGHGRPATAAVALLRLLGVTETTAIAEGLIADCDFSAAEVNPEPLIDPGIEAVMATAFAYACRESGAYPVIDTPHLLIGLLALDPPPLEMLARLRATEITPDLAFEALQMLKGEGPAPADAAVAANADPIAALTVDLVRLAREGRLDPVIGREVEIDRLITVLSRRRKNSPVLIGEPGVGKTAIVGALAARIAAGNVPPRLRSARILAFSPARLVAGTVYRGQFEERVNRFLDALKRDSQAILFIDELHTIVGAGGGVNETNDLSNLLKPALASGEIAVIGATTREEYRRFIEPDSALERRFAPIEVEEPTPAETRRILAGIVAHYAAHHGVSYSKAVLDACVTEAARHLPSRRFPDKAIDLMDEAGAEASKNGRRAVSAADVRASLPAAAAAQRTRRPIRLAAALGRHIVGQEHTIDTVAEMIAIRRLALTERTAPLAVFLFAGPAGVGKSALAAALADELFGGALTTIDLAEFGEQHTVSALIGTPPGYVGYEQKARLIEPLRHTPAQVVLLKHVEAAHPSIRALLADLLRTGELADTHERSASFRSAVVILTTTDEGLGHGELGFRHAPEGASDQDAALRSRLADRLGAGLVEPVDEVCAFGSLDATALGLIADARIAAIGAGLGKRGISLLVSGAVRERIVTACGTRGGARDLGRLVERFVERPIAATLAGARGTRGLSIEIEGDRSVARSVRRTPSLRRRHRSLA